MMKSLEDVQLCFPQHINASCKKLKRSHFEIILFNIILSSISVLTITLNLLVIISISHFKQLHTPTNLLLLSLAVSDFFVGLLMVFQIMLIEDGCWFLGDLICAAYQYLGYIITSASIGNMVLISVDRYVAICHPLHYSTNVTLKRVQVCVSLCWICSVIFHSLVLKDVLQLSDRMKTCLGECVVVIDYVAGLADMILSFIGPVIVIVVLYMRVFIVVVSQARAMRSHSVAVTIQHSVKVTAKTSELKAARTLGVVIVVFLICLCPYFSAAISGQDNLLNASSAAFVICVFYFNSCLNPVIYAFFYAWFRKCLRFIVTLQILQSGSREANIL